MTEAAQQPSSIAIDQSRRYKVAPGEPCEKCGYYKTWEFRVLNPKTGKLMPGHVTRDGYKIGDGNCPFWGNLKKNKAEKPAAPLPASNVPDAAEFFKQSLPSSMGSSPAKTGTGTTATTGTGTTATIVVQRDGGRILLALGQARVAVEKDQAIKLAHELLDAIAS
ncbi:MAG: hypothetical protein GYA24_09845 [Candidatus Lokiarchaeota archaeon]|nr:hypothetical protein [Candidatus Lokiarchaeota archaeon]